MKRSWVGMFGGICCSSLLMGAHPPAWSGALAAGGGGFDGALALAVDGPGNRHVTGQFHETATFGTNQIVAEGGVFADLFLAKYDPAGNLLWVVGGGGSEEDSGNAVAVDAQGNIYITGGFRGTASFGNTNLTSRGLEDMFVAKYSGSGQLLWIRQAGGTGRDFGSGIAVVGTNCYVVGAFESAIQLDDISLVSAGVFDGLVARYDGAGNVDWAQRAGGVLDDRAMAVAADDAGNCVVTGYFVSSNASFGNLTATNTSPLHADVFVVKYASAGNPLWLRTGGGGHNDRGLGVAVDSHGGVRVAGVFASPNAAFNTATITNRGGDDAFLVCYDGFGEVRWLRAAGGSGRDLGVGVAIDVAENSYLVGNYSGLASFGDSSIGNPASPTAQAIFVARYDNDGRNLWVKSSTSDSDDTVFAVGLDTIGKTHIAGAFSSAPVRLDDLALVPAGDNDVLLATLEVELPELYISLQSNAVQVSWSAYHSGFKLYSMDALTNSGNENLVTNATVLIEDRLVITLPRPAAERYYRLVKAN